MQPPPSIPADSHPKTVDWKDFIPTRRSLLSRLKHWDDQRSWQQFDDTYSGLIYRAAREVGLTETEAEDVVQDTLVAVAKGIGEFRYEPERCRFKTWLHQVVRRQVVNQFRKRQGKGRVPAPLSLDATEPDAIAEMPDPASRSLDEAWDREWEINLLHAAADRVKRQVSPAQFQVFEYRDLQGHSATETARALNISLARVYLTSHRLRARVRAELEYLRSRHD
jgi:RNA polymerase sigma-70 factor (ECF subfamily)